MYDEKSNKGAKFKTLNIPEDLGQIEIIFTDKTGTLTENKMILKSCSINGQDYQQDIDYDNCTVKPNKDLMDNLSGKTVRLENDKRMLEKFFLGLAICNTVS